MVPGGLRRVLSKLWYGIDTLPSKKGSDLRSLGPIHLCPCGSQVFNAMVSFEDYEISWYFLDAECVSCGNLVKIPCPVDKPV